MHLLSYSLNSFKCIEAAPPPFLFWRISDRQKRGNIVQQTSRALFLSLITLSTFAVLPQCACAHALLCGVEGGSWYLKISCRHHDTLNISASIRIIFLNPEYHYHSQEMWSWHIIDYLSLCKSPHHPINVFCGYSLPSRIWLWTSYCIQLSYLVSLL